ncbi:MAG: protoheme IX farnesyltransferase [Anaerolineales bacterium]|nr:protoheme IX farnesyltransferase [Chloroflexota bacterium]MBL6979594.1 protoheme IX farnesyltransferase [Anaerolineales bacterium]
MPKSYSALRTLKAKYWPLIKSLQTFLLLLTGLAGYMSARCPVFNIGTVLSVTGSLFISISGSTVLNMWYDRDIDARMNRTCWRPLPAGIISPPEALRFGLLISILGIGWALAIDLLYGAIVFAGLFFDVVIYTIWLKRRTCWSIVWGGISGGMPVLAGRALGLGYIDWIGLALTFAILFWIPTHILTFSMRYFDDYKTAGVPTFPLTYGFQFTRVTIAISSVIAAVAMIAAAVGIGMDWGYLRLIGVLSVGLLGLAIAMSVRPSERVNFGLFKYASLFMLGAMVMIVLDVI